jgi:hypothetical protein
MKKKNKVRWSWILGIIVGIAIIGSAILIRANRFILFGICWFIAMEGVFILCVINEKSKWELKEVIGTKFVLAIISGFMIWVLSYMIGALEEAYKIAQGQWIQIGKWSLIVIGIMSLITGYFYLNYKLANKIK